MIHPKVLFVTSKSDDFISACLWDGLQEVCREENVIDVGETPCLHSWLWKSDAEKSPSARIGAYRKGECLGPKHSEWKFNLIVINACFNRDYDWRWAAQLVERWLAIDGKVVYVEGWDSACHEVHPPEPPCQIDRVFRREIDPHWNYPYACIPLSFAAPARWLGQYPHSVSKNPNRPIDVFFSGTNDGPIRKQMFAEIGRMHGRHRIVMSSAAFPMEDYFRYLRASKFALCPPGCDGCDAMRFWEVTACGCIPIFIGLPKKVRGEWFSETEALFVEDAKELPDLIDAAVSVDMEPIRKEMVERVLSDHTTHARAYKVLQAVGLK